jgi:hypothetical protein
VTEEEERLFRAFVELRTADNKTPEAGPVPGMGTRTLRRYIVDKEVPSSLSDHVKAAMARFMASRGVTGYERFEDVEEEPEPDSSSRDWLGRQLEWVRNEIGDITSKTALVRELRGFARDTALIAIADALKMAEENAKTLSQERVGHRDAILQMDRADGRWSKGQQVKDATDAAAKGPKDGARKPERKVR